MTKRTEATLSRRLIVKGSRAGALELEVQTGPKEGFAREVVPNLQGYSRIYMK